MLLTAFKKKQYQFLLVGFPAFVGSCLWWSTEENWALVIDRTCLAIFLTYLFIRCLRELSLLVWMAVSVLMVAGATVWSWKKANEDVWEQDFEDVVHASFHVCFIAAFHLMATKFEAK